MNYKKKVLKELETVLTRNQRAADVHIYSRTTRDGQELYFRRYGTHTDIAHDPIDFDNDCDGVIRDRGAPEGDDPRNRKYNIPL